MLKRTLAIFVVVLSFGLIVPAGAAAADRDRGNNAGIDTNINWEQGKWGKRRNGPYRRYKNYGQYRSSRVGNRRYRLVRRPYYRDGRRYIRVVRIYY
jgi:hypothetical protein